MLRDLTLSGTAHTNAGTYATDSWTFSDATGNYNNTSGTVSDSIAKAGLTITAATNTKTYDVTTTASATPTVSGLQGSDTVAALVEAYADANAGSGKSLSSPATRSTTTTPAGTTLFRWSAPWA